MEITHPHPDTRGTEEGSDRLLRQFSEPSPAISIMPVDDDIRRPNVVPPLFKLLARNVERGRRDEVVEDDRMLLSPVEV